MARSGTLSNIAVIFGLIVFLIGLVGFVMSLSRGAGIQVLNLLTIGVGLAGIVIGRRIARKARKQTSEG